jgi:predicted membrane protein
MAALPTTTAERSPARMSLPALAVALGLLILLTIHPSLVCTAKGQVDYPATLLLIWAMCVGFIRGVGFVPRARPLRLAFSGVAVAGAVLLAAARLADSTLFITL